MVGLSKYKGHSINKGNLKKKKKKWKINFFYKCKLYIVWNWVIGKIILILPKCLLFGIQNCS